MKSIDSSSLKVPHSARTDDWINSTKTMLLNSSQWKALTHEIYSLIQRDLNESHITYFSDLSEKERSMFMDRAQRAVSQSHVYEAFEDMLFEVCSLHYNKFTHF